MAEKLDIDPQETKEWLDAARDVLNSDGEERVQFILGEVSKVVGSVPNPSGGGSTTTSPLNTISVSSQGDFPGNVEIEEKITNINRWNTMAMVTKANKESDGLGGHIATYTSAATLYEIGYNHFFKGRTADSYGDQIFVQGHASPGIYARAFFEGILSKEQAQNFRREFKGNGGLPSYPHPRLLKNFWQFPTVSMGLGPILAIYVARFNRYLNNRKIKDTSKSHVWAFLGDGELSEPEVYGSIAVANREMLDNLTFVVNCNLQRLDGPVYGNGSIVKEAEGMFRGAGWNVIKVIWPSAWDKVFAEDKNGVVASTMDSITDGDLQSLPLKSASEVRDFLIGKNPEIKDLLSLLSDETLTDFEWGGQDLKKIYAAYQQAVNNKNGKPTAILVRTVKGYGMGSSGEALNTAHNIKKMDAEPALKFVKSAGIPLSEEQVRNFEFYLPPKNSPEQTYLEEIRKKMGSFIPKRIEFDEAEPLKKFDEKAFDKFYQGGGDREYSTTKSYVQILSALLRDASIKNNVVPVICDEARTFGMEGLFGQHAIYSPKGQLYTPVDAKTLMPYKEKVDGQIFQEGISEAGSIASFISAGTSYSYQGVPMIPFYAFYSMFGFQRIGDSIWQALDMRCKGFLMGGTSGRTTLNGEGLQHEDGHSLVVASVYPTIKAYDPAFEFEMVSLIKEGINKMYYKGEDCLYYLTMYNENIKHPAMPKHVTDKDISAGAYLFEKSSDKPDVNLISGGITFKDALEAKAILEQQFKLKVNIYSAPSFKSLRDEAIVVDRQKLLNPDKKLESYVEKLFKGQKAPFVAATDYVRAWPEMIRPWIPSRFMTLGTDGFGHSSSREELRLHFEVNKNYIAYTALYALFTEGTFSLENLKKAQKSLGIDVKKISGLDDIAL